MPSEDQSQLASVECRVEGVGGLTGRVVMDEAMRTTAASFEKTRQGLPVSDDRPGQGRRAGTRSADRPHTPMAGPFHVCSHLETRAFAVGTSETRL